jgi:hypothetical protein
VCLGWLRRSSTSFLPYELARHDSIKTLDRDRKASEKEKCISWVISAGRNAMVQSRDEVRTDLIDRTERNKLYLQAMSLYFFSLRLAAASAAEAVQVDEMLRYEGVTVSV